MTIFRTVVAPYLAVTFLLSGPTARANEAHLTVKGGSPKYRRNREHPDIQLVSERVRATIYEPRRGKKDFKARVACAFVFKNHSDRPVRVTMGFPEHGRGSLRLKDVLLKKFRSTVDGKRIRVRRKVVRAASPYRRSRARPRSSPFNGGPRFPTRGGQRLESLSRKKGAIRPRASPHGPGKVLAKTVIRRQLAFVLFRLHSYHRCHMEGQDRQGPGPGGIQGA